MTLTESDKNTVETIVQSYTGIPSDIAVNMARGTVRWLYSPAAYREYSGERLARFQKVWDAVLNVLQEADDENN